MVASMTQIDNEILGLAGQGKLFQALQASLAEIYHIEFITAESAVEQLLSCALIICCTDSWSPETVRRLNQRCVHLGVALFPVSLHFTLGIIGPCVLPHRAGCATCAEQRRLGALWDENEQAFYSQSPRAITGMGAQPSWLTGWSQDTLVQVVLEEIVTYFRSPTRVRTRQAQLYFALDTQHISLHHFLPLSNCPVCGSQPVDTPELATIVLQSRKKPAPFSYHVRDLAASEEALLQTYADSYLGVISGITAKNSSVQPHMYTSMQLAIDARWRSITAMGTAARWSEARIAAIAEALERLAGHYPQKKRTAIYASYRQLTVPALDPTTLGLHSPEQYDQPGFRFVPYHHDLKIHWIWGYSLTSGRPLLVPETCAYYGETTQQAFVYEISNGCALGGCIEEAIFYGILEVAERDAFLLTWYAQLALPRLDLTTITDQSTRMFITHIQQLSGYTLHAFNATLDHAVPCLWVMAVDEQQLERPRVLCAAGSHPHPEVALTRALRELGAMLFPLVDAETLRQNTEHLLKMFHNPFEVQSMSDHAHLYWLPEAFERLSFLYHSPRHQSFQEAFADFYAQPPRCMDLRDDLLALIDHYRQHGIDIVVVDQTSPEQEYHDLHCVKVLMPGTLSMTFGHAYRRTTGCQRLSLVPYTFGYRAQPLREGESNPHPHPFP